MAPPDHLVFVSISVVAHQGGWDEILWVTVPILVMVGLLRIATKRVRRGDASQTSDSHDVGTE